MIPNTIKQGRQPRRVLVAGNISPPFILAAFCEFAHRHRGLPRGVNWINSCRPPAGCRNARQQSACPAFISGVSLCTRHLPVNEPHAWHVDTVKKLSRTASNTAKAGGSDGFPPIPAGPRRQAPVTRCSYLHKIQNRLVPKWEYWAEVAKRGVRGISTGGGPKTNTRVASVNCSVGGSMRPPLGGDQRECLTPGALNARARGMRQEADGETCGNSWTRPEVAVEARCPWPRPSGSASRLATSRAAPIPLIGDANPTQVSSWPRLRLDSFLTRLRLGSVRHPRFRYERRPSGVTLKGVVD